MKQKTEMVRDVLVLGKGIPMNKFGAHLVGLAVSAGLGGMGCGSADLGTDDWDEGATLDTVEQEIKNGTVTTDKPGIGSAGLAGGCTATLISGRHALVAAHCNWHGDTLWSGKTFTAGGVTRTISRIYLFGPEEAPGQGIPAGNLDFNPDVALLELDSEIPLANATPLNVAAGPPNSSWQVTMYGRGGTTGACTGAFGTKRYFTFNFGTNTYQFCPGDSGGPGTFGTHAENGAIWGVASFTSGNGDVWGNVGRYKEDIRSVIRMWDYGSSSGLNGLEFGIKRNGVTLATYGGSSANACQTLCNGNANCNSFRFQLSTSTCTLLKDAGDWVPDTNHWSGLSSTNRFENGVNRLGYDYTNHATSSASQCSRDCSDDERCAAFSWVASQTRCYLREYLGLTTASSGVTSGTKRNFEYYTDRPGFDIATYDLTTSDIRVCQSLCSAHPSCYAYTYRNPVFTPADPPVLVADAKCWLKGYGTTPVTSVADAPSGNKRYISGTWRSTP